MSRLILSIFPGADLFGRGFEAEGFCVVRGPDLVWGGDVRSFHPAWGKFHGIIGGSPCQDFSRKRRAAPTGNGLAMLGEFCRCIREAEPDWFVLENVTGVPSIAIKGYSVQRFNLNAAECGGLQRRLRTFQFGSRDGTVLVCDRTVTVAPGERTCMATDRPWGQDKRGFADFCELQGLPRDFDLPGLSLTAKYRAVGNGVPVYMARVIARAVLNRSASLGVTLCACGCGRRVTPRHAHHVAATAACRKRLERSRRAVTSPA